MGFVDLAIALLFTILIVQDFRSREVSVIWLVTLMVLLVTKGMYFLSIPLSSVLVSALVLTVQLGIVILYFRIMGKRRFINSLFGLGDLLLILGFVFVFDTLTFLLFWLICIVFGVIYGGIAKMWIKCEEFTIPLISVLGCVYLVLIALNYTNILPFFGSDLDLYGWLKYGVLPND